MGLFDLLFGGVKEGVKEGVTTAFASEEVQLSFDKLMQTGYDLGRADEKNGKPHRNFTLERHAKERKQ